MDNTYLFDQFVFTQAGEPYRLFPFGRVVKNGNVREITPEYARKFKLPHFKPPIKLGSHEEETPAGGHIIGLEVREDGLYAIPEWNEKGLGAIRDGAYRYQSPEVVWDDGGLEDPQSGDYIMGPLILGDAMLHTPHLGEAAALYEVQIVKEKKMETVNIPTSFWEKFTAFLDAKLNPPQEAPPALPEDYEVSKRERDEYKAKLDAIEREAQEKARVEKFAAELAQTDATADLAPVLAGLTDENAELILRELRALTERVKVSALTEQKSTEGEAVEDPKAAFNALVLKYSAEHKLPYNRAFEIVKAENKELFTAWAVREK
jgi:hypothetical protein